LGGESAGVIMAMRTLITNNKGEVEVDPFNNKGKHEKWLKKINKDGKVNYHMIP
jgi:hypothetical protein